MCSTLTTFWSNQLCVLLASFGISPKLFSPCSAVGFSRDPWCEAQKKGKSADEKRFTAEIKMRDIVSPQKDIQIHLHTAAGKSDEASAFSSELSLKASKLPSSSAQKMCSLRDGVSDRGISWWESDVNKVRTSQFVWVPQKIFFDGKSRWWKLQRSGQSQQSMKLEKPSKNFPPRLLINILKSNLLFSHPKTFSSATWKIPN